MGYAEKLGYDATGYNPRVNANGWYTYTSSSALNNLKPGDIVRYKNDGHSIYVTNVNGDTVTFTDCNSDYHCVIRWGATISKSTLRSSFTHLRSAPSSVLPGSDSCSCSTSYAGKYTTKNVNSSLTIRSGHGTGYSVKGSIPANATFTVSKANGSWAHVTYNGTSGYVSCEYIQKVTENQVDSRYPTPFKAYCISDGKVAAYDSVNGSKVGNIYGNTDFCEILSIYTNGWAKVRCPWSGYTNGRIVYVEFSVFLKSGNRTTPKTATAVNKTTAYFVAGGTGSPGSVYVGDTCTIIGESGNQVCVICPWKTSSYNGKYMIWCNKSAFQHTHSYGSWGNYDSNYHSKYCSCGNMQKASHTWNQGVISISASCTEKGTRKYTCTVCGATKTESISATGHSYNQGVVTTSATCTSTGVKTYTCTKCGATKKETISKTSHSYTVKNTSSTYLKSAATCKSYAVYYYSCSCGLKGSSTFTSGSYASHSYTNTGYNSAHPHAIYKLCGTCGYKNYTGNYKNISSCNECNPPVTLKSISVKQAPTKTTYKIGESLDTTGMKLLLTYSDGSTATLTNGFTVSGFNSDTAGTKTVIAFYGGKTTEFKVIVEPNVSKKSPKIVVENKTVTAGEEVKIQINLKDNPGIAGLAVSLKYDDNVFTLKKVENGKLFAGFMANKNFTWDESEDVYKDGVLANLTFKVAENAKAGDYSIGVIVRSCTNEDLDDITPSVQAGKITVLDSLNLGKPSLKSIAQSTSAIKLTWTAVSKATDYKIYQMVNGNWEPISDVTGTSVTLKKLKAGTKYTFAVKAGTKVDGKVVWAKDYLTVNTATKAVAPSKVTAKQNTSAIQLSWTKCEGATGYRIYYKSGNSWKTALSTTTATSHTFKKLKAGAKYTFAVRPYIKTDSGVVWSSYTQFITATKPANVTAKATSTSKGTVKLTWNEVNGAELYQVYYKTGNGSFKLYKTYTDVKSLSFKNLKSGTKYTFAVRAGIKTDAGNVYGGYKTSAITVK